MEQILYICYHKSLQIMTTIDLRKTVNQYVNNADIHLLEMIKALVEGYQSNKQEPTLTKEQYHLIDQRRNSHLNHKSKSSTWEQVKKNARKMAQ